MKMTTNNKRSGQGTVAFTLVELLVVISIIGIVAGLSVAAMSGAGEARDRKAVEAQKAKLILAIEDYKSKFGSYPPDRLGATSTLANARTNALAYELGGTRRSGANFQFEADPGHVVTPVTLNNNFGVGGILNATPSTTVRGKSFMPMRGGTGKTADYVLMPTGVILLKVVAEHPSLADNVWFYRSYPTNGHNPKSYDLWAEIKKRGGTTNVISNWK